MTEQLHKRVDAEVAALASSVAPTETVGVTTRRPMARIGTSDLVIG